MKLHLNIWFHIEIKKNRKGRERIKEKSIFNIQIDNSIFNYLKVLGNPGQWTRPKLNLKCDKLTLL